ncbi:hypothetical protein L6164_032721 [Bauhinia variegata]|uniref:Uncharacterized protein n=1 Tax=Bauhinia variegata TaxID=167791 RepID=A0ACB9KPG0_BAUVA|nr:hypothetical protein L6164_032721 [Bauhinia variegata]
MSKKKTSGNTMTLKDFHGGSIPTDLSLPSAPGVTVRSSDRSGFDRPSSWGNPIGRPEHRSRPHTSPVTRHYDDKTPFLTHTVQIGRNFDEDERKPLDGISAPRRTINAESIRVPHARVEVKPEYGQGGSLLGRQVAPVSQSPVGAVNSYSGRLTEAIHSGVNSQNLGGGRVQGTGGGYPNAWAMRKEVASAVEPEQSASAWSAPYAASKLAHASAIEKVSSGRWQSKTVHYQTDAELVRSSEVENASRSNVNINNAYNRMDSMGEKEYYDAILARHAERSLGIDDPSQGGRHELLNHEGSGVSRYSEVRPRSVGYNTDEIQLVQNDGKLGGSDLQHPMPSDQKERPKLKLLLRTKPLENFETSVTDNVQGHQRISNPVHVETVNEVSVHTNFVKPISAGTESGKEVAHRPKLNLKPRSEPLEQLEGNSERGRDSLFGGARPRELVLKERGMDDVVINNYDVIEHSNRVERHNVRAEKLSDQSAQIRHVEKTEDALLDQRAGKKSDRKDQRVDAERGNAQRKNWRGGDNRRNTRETERQQVFERHPSPETWRKPVEEPKSSAGDAGMHYGKAASAVDLAQTFSRSVSDSKTSERLPSQRVLNSGRPQIPFSRLVGPTSRPSINGY